jgi:hypothetical protein
MMQRYLELERAGVGRAEAIREVERHIPNYRIPDQVLGSRGISRFLQDPTFGQFNRYHYSMFKSWGNVIGDALGITARQGHLTEDMIRGNGELFATFMMAGVLYGPINSAVQSVSGNKNASMRATGPITALDAAASILNGTDEYTRILRYAIMFSPAVNLLDEFWTNRDVFGRHPIEASTPRQWAGQALEAGVTAAIAPYSAVHQAFSGGRKGLAGAGTSLLEQGTGIKLPTREAVVKRKKWLVSREIAAARRAKKPQGPIERLVVQ